VTVRLQPVVECDRVLTPACHRRLDVPHAELVRGTAAVRRALLARGWALEGDPGGRWLDVCPACAAALRDAPAPTEPGPGGAAAGPGPAAAPPG
jgi:hypothetical protein